MSEWVRTEADKHAVAAGCYFDLAAAERVRTFFEKFLRHSTGEFEGQPFKLLDWQWDRVIAPLFGWKNADGTRRFRTAYISTGKKNGKSGLISGLTLYLLLGDNEPGAEVYSAACDRNQASIIYREAKKMIDVSPLLTARLNCIDSSKRIVGPRASFYRALSADAKLQEGLNASAVLFDELHAQPNRDLWDTLRYAGSARRQPLLIAITTAGEAGQPSICREVYDYAKRVESGEVADVSFLPVIFEAAADDAWDDPDTWAKANPSFGVTIKADAFRADFLEAKESPAKENAFRRYRLNQWTSVADSWLSLDAWDACAGKVDPAALRGQPCFAGLDLSATDDTTALVLLFPSDDGVVLLPRFYLPGANIAGLERKHRVPYRAWAKAGHMTLTEGNVVDYQQIRRDLGQLATVYDIQKLVIDRKFQGQQLESELIEDGFDVMPAGQGWLSQDLPAKELERLLLSRQLQHAGHPVLRWHAGNAVVDIDKAGNYSLNKRKSRSKIDGIAATLMALFAQMRAGPRTIINYYEKNPELIVLEM